MVNDGWPPLARGGAESVAAALAGHYAKRGHEVAVLTSLRPGQTAPSPVDLPGISRIYAAEVSYPKLLRPYLSLFNPRTQRAVRRALDEFRPHVAHIHNIHRYLTYGSLSTLHARGVPMVMTMHDAMSVDYGRFVQAYRGRTAEPLDYRVRVLPTLKRYHIQYFPLRNALIRRRLRDKVDTICVPSRDLKKLLQANGLTVDQVVPNGIDPGPESAVVDLEAAPPRSVPSSIAMVGRLIDDKGIYQALAATRLVRERGHPIELQLIGGRKGDNPPFDRAVARLGMDGAVAYRGWLSEAELRKAYRENAAIVVPSICLDVYPTVVLEAMANAVPVIATRFGGASEAVEHGVSGFVVNPFDETEMADRICELLVNPEEYFRMGRRGLKAVHGPLHIGHATTRYLGLLSELVGSDV